MSSTKQALVLGLLLIPSPAFAVGERDTMICAMKDFAIDIAKKFFVGCTASISAYYLARTYPLHQAILFDTYETLQQVLRRREYDHPCPLGTSVFKVAVMKNDFQALNILATECLFSRKLALLPQEAPKVPSLRMMCAKRMTEMVSELILHGNQVPRDVMPEIFRFVVHSLSLEQQRALIADAPHNAPVAEYLVQAHCERHFAYVQQIFNSIGEESDFLHNGERNECMVFINAVRDAASFYDLDASMQVAIEDNISRRLGLEIIELD